LVNRAPLPLLVIEDGEEFGNARVVSDADVVNKEANVGEGAIAEAAVDATDDSWSLDQ
jgi:hypothetical protein